MSMLKTVAKVTGGLVGVVLLGVGGGFVWASSTADAKMATHFAVHTVDFPIPTPLTADEVAALRAEKAAQMPPVDPKAKVDPIAAPPGPLAGVDLDAVAHERALARGKHLVEARYVCTACHGANFGGGVMLDDPAIGRFLAPNITTGKGSRTVSYKAADWDHIVRHGIKPDGTAAVMPSVDFFKMTDQELSDVVTYIRSQPPVDNTVEPCSLGPIGKVLVATDQMKASATLLPDHQAMHAAFPPAAVPDAAYGEHIMKVCSGCHREDFTGGPIVGGDPSWPPAANLTPGPDGLAGWTYDDFVTTLKTAKAKNGVALRPPMSDIVPYAGHMTEDETHAMWAYLQTLPPKPDGT